MCLIYGHTETRELRTEFIFYTKYPIAMEKFDRNNGLLNIFYQPMYLSFGNGFSGIIIC